MEVETEESRPPANSQFTQGLNQIVELSRNMAETARSFREIMNRFPNFPLQDEEEGENPVKKRKRDPEGQKNNMKDTEQGAGTKDHA